MPRNPSNTASHPSAPPDERPTLRDLAAFAALTGYMNSAHTIPLSMLTANQRDDRIAEAMYAIADAMLRAREVQS